MRRFVSQREIERVQDRVFAAIFAANASNNRTLGSVVTNGANLVNSQQNSPARAFNRKKREIH